MPLHDLPLILITRHLRDMHLGEALFFPEIVALHAKTDRLAGQLRALARQILANSAPLDVHRRVIGTTPECSRILLHLDPPKKSLAWAQPIALNLDVLRWRHANQASIAYLPGLGIEVVAAREEDLDSLIPQHARAALARLGWTDRLFDLAQLERIESISLERETITAEIPTPAQLAAEDAQEESAKGVIEEAGTILDDTRVTPAWEMDAQVNRLADALVGRVPRSVLLVGASGVGKTTVFHELFRRRKQHHLGASPFWMTSGVRLIAGVTGLGVWQERCLKLCRQARQEGAILHLGNLVELMEVGKAGGSQFGVASFFRPYLSRGDFLAVAECTPEQLPVIERAHPHLLAIFQVVNIEEPSAEVGRAILKHDADAFAQEQADAHSTAPAPMTDEALSVLDFLHRRYATYSAAPGRPLRFLRNLLRDRLELSNLKSPVAPITSSEITAAFSRETGLPPFLIDNTIPLDLAASRNHFASRVIGQDQAVDRITDLLATVKAALNRPRRPIASLLFIGPTGVGKTEMAKALSDYFFGDSSQTGATRIVRFDMSEFATAAAVSRLIGTAWETEGLLTSKVREQPFCVVLLDEFEKAHPAFFDLLLQVLGEGRLTDSAGRLSDFSNAIVVMTSNLGAQTFGSGPFGLARATTDAAAHASAHFTDAVRDFVRPELFNRIDSVIPFHPLGREVVEKIAAREISLIARRDGIRQRELQLDVTPAAIGHLARAGYDPLYGARPLKRRIDRDLIAPLADAVNQYAPAVPLVASVDVAGDQLTVTVRGRMQRTGIEEQTSAQALSFVAGVAANAASLRRRAQRLARCPASLSLQNELFTLDRLIQRKAAHPGNRQIDPAQRDRRRRLQTLADAIAQLTGRATAVEDALLIHRYEGAALPYETSELPHRLAQCESTARDILLHLFTLNRSDPHAITVALYGNAPSALFALAAAYRRAALSTPSNDSVPGDRISPSVEISYYTRLSKNTLGRTAVMTENSNSFLSQPRGGVLGIALAIRAPFALARFETDSGLHVIEDERNKNPHAILVDTSALPLSAYRPPKDVEFRIALAGKRRRTYTLDRCEAADTVTSKTYRWSGDHIEEALVAAMNEHLHQRTEAMLQD